MIPEEKNTNIDRIRIFFNSCRLSVCTVGLFLGHSFTGPEDDKEVYADLALEATAPPDKK